MKLFFLTFSLFLLLARNSLVVSCMMIIIIKQEEEEEEEEDVGGNTHIYALFVCVFCVFYSVLKRI